MKKVKVLLIYSLLIILSSCQFLERKSEVQKTPAESSSQPLFVNEPHTLIRDSRQLTFVGPKSGEGYFSPDGKWMIFQSEREPGNPFYQMFVMNLETGATTRVSPGKGKTTCGWIHPSMKRVMYSSTHLDPKTDKNTQEEYENRKKAVKARYSWSFDSSYDIFSSDLDGKNIKRLTKEPGYDAEGSYSPDGQWIAFASNRAGYTETLSPEDKKLFDQDSSYMMDIYIMKADGTQVKRLTTSKGYDGGPFFSADGKKITWRRFSPNGSTAEIFTMNVDGTEQKQVTHLKSMSWAPFFHPSGDYIIFGSSILGYSNFELFIVDSEGKQKPVRVTFDEGFDGLPVFTPDGNGLSWTHRSEKGESQILMSKWDDAKARELLRLPAQNPTTTGALQPEVRIEDVKKWVYYLAGPAMQGRGTGTAEEKVYADKIAQAFKSWGLVGAGAQGSFFDTFEFTSGVSLGSNNELEVVGSYKKKYTVSQDYEPISFSKVGHYQEAPIVFAGFGIKAPAGDKEVAYDSYKGLDVKGKWVVVLADLPNDATPARRQYLNLYARLQHKVTVAKNEGAIGLLVVNGPESGLKDRFGKIKFEGSLSESNLAVLRLSTPAAVELFKYAGKDLAALERQLDKGEATEGFAIASAYIKANIDLQFKKSTGTNVIAKLPVRNAKSNVVIGAHGDHLGFGQFGSTLAKGDEQGKAHLGADDNASGVAGVMELAHYYSNLQKTSPNMLKKNLYFAVWSGEELGNLGSSHFAKKLPAHTEAYLNMDMIGRLKDRLFVQGTGSAANWAPLVEEVGVRVAVPLTVQEDPYLPTDSMAFYLVQVPTVNFFTGSHAEYHSPRDTAELINYPGVVRVLDVVRALTNLVVDSSQQMVKYVKVGGSQGKMEGRSFRVYLGTIPDYSQEGVQGVRISGVSKGSPSETAGLKENDIIIEFDGTKIENLYDYVYTLQAVKPNKETVIKVKRNGKVEELKITPKLKE